MKPGYKIIIGALIVYGIYHYLSEKSKEELLYKKRVDSIITDIRHEDYFSLQNKLAPNISDKISIEDIKQFSKDLNLTKNSKFILNEIDKKSNYIKVVGEIVTKSKKLQYSGTFIDKNGTLLINSQVINNRKLEATKTTFPINL